MNERTMGIGRPDRPKITMLTFTNLSFLGGTEQFLLNVARNAPLDRLSLSIIQTDFEDPSRKKPADLLRGLEGVTVLTIKSITPRMVAFDQARHKALRRLFLILRFFIELLSSPYYRFANRAVLDVADRSDLVFLIRDDDSRFIRRRGGKPVIIGSTQVDSLDGAALPLHVGLTGALVRLRYRKIDGFHLLTRNLAKTALVRGRYDFILPNGVDTEMFRPPEADSRDPDVVRFLFVGRLEEYKGVTKLLEAWDAVRKDNFELHIVGAGGLAAEVVRRSGGSRVRYHGSLPPAEVASVMRSCDVFVFPTEGENFGIVVAEALSSGLYVLCSDRQRGIFDDFESRGLLKYVPNDPRSIGAAMLDSARALDSIRGRRAQVHELARDRYEWAAISRSLFSKLLEILGHPREA